MSTKPVVAVAMSGGVDSSVAAALLVEQGYQVIGIMLRLWSEQDKEQVNRCCTPDSMALARQVASILSIPFYVLDARQVFYNSVVKPFIDDYTQNITPNPCITCNRVVRWKFLFNYALAAGTDYLATGHYARVVEDSNHIHRLYRAADLSKDQSYVLHVMTQSKLKHALFPLGGYKKQEVRQLAHQYKLPVANRPDSQDLCFIGGDGDYRPFLLRHAPATQKPGNILNQNGNVLGHHDGLPFYTIGQRRGLRISSDVPLYVLAKDVSQNALIVGPREDSARDHLIADQVNWIEAHPPASSFIASVKIRYNAKNISGMVNIINNKSFQIQFNSKIPDITPGQAAVLYNGDGCLGGGIICSSNNYDEVER